MKELTTEELKLDKEKTDPWVAIQGKVYHVAEYAKDHPEGMNVLLDVAGQDATAAYKDVGHSEDANEILESYVIDTLKDATDFKRREGVRLAQHPLIPPKASNNSDSMVKLGVAAGTTLSLRLVLLSQESSVNIPELSRHLPQLGRVVTGKLSDSLPHGEIVNGALAKAACSMSNLHPAPGILPTKGFKALPVIAKDFFAPNVYRLVFQLPHPHDVTGLPFGQHVAIKANFDGQFVSRSYTPRSNNLELSRLGLVVKHYEDGLLTGEYVTKLEVGDKVLFRGPKGSTRYKNGLGKNLGMIAGGTGIAPMCQLIRVICEDEIDTTEISPIYANRKEEGILLRTEPEAYVEASPRTLRVWYVLDHPQQKRQYGNGYMTPAVMRERRTSSQLIPK
ncbi:Uncharacterized protein PECH_001714 [Penicillium ucsense]|uniref:Cytochrome b5 heme-binding domain-containing protein n=1 Tax=Penicillium ucsense TaxID=2839758 RepID=A0A8J8VWV0_9EURO|nr:Uncharacterized protein PECM_001532 [Penicillium ucsense]KAF7732420.1 Uncharacterized protein PECH_001714 [Penicillium ucsense]